MAFRQGQRVVLQGLQARPALNGAEGVVKGFDKAKERYAVQLTTEEKPLLLKLANLRLFDEPVAAPNERTDFDFDALLAGDDFAHLRAYLQSAIARPGARSYALTLNGVSLPGGRTITSAVVELVARGDDHPTRLVHQVC